MQTAQIMADYYLEQLPDDYIPYWDFDLSGDDILKDASARAILASSLYDLASFSSPPLKEKYKFAADNITKSLL